MKSLDRRIARLEVKYNTSCGQRFVYILPNLEEDEDEETPYQIKLSSDLWAHAIRGGPFTAEEIDELRNTYGDERTRNEPEATS
jgi:hypothetical protein